MSPFIGDLIMAGAVLGGSVLAAAVVCRILSRLAKRADASESIAAASLLRSLRFPVWLLVVLGGLYVGLTQIAVIRVTIESARTVFQVAATVVVLLTATSISGFLLELYASHVERVTGSRPPVGLLRKLAVLAIWVLGSIQILAELGQSVGTVLAAVGIAGLGIGLALQDTIANLFAGFYIVADRSLRVGDYVKLENGDEGFVESIGWRNARIRLWSNNLVLVPNSTLTQSILTNMHLPAPALTVYTWCGVSYDSDLEHVERVTLDVAAQILDSYPGGDLSFEPVVRFKEFGDSNITFVVAFRAVEVGAQYLLQHEFIKALHKRFREEGIEISFPVRKLVWQDDSPRPVRGLQQ